MYSRNAKTPAEERYAKNIPPVYGGSRFYRTPPDRAEEIPRGGQNAGIAAQYEGIPLVSKEADTHTESTVCPPAEEPPTVCDRPAADERKEEGPGFAPKNEAKPPHHGGFLSSLIPGDQEELLLIAILLLLCGEESRSPDMIALLLLLIILK